MAHPPSGKALMAALAWLVAGAGLPLDKFARREREKARSRRTAARARKSYSNARMSGIGAAECARRRRQIERGQLNGCNGLVVRPRP